MAFKACPFSRVLEEFLVGSRMWRVAGCAGRPFGERVAVLAGDLRVTPQTKGFFIRIEKGAIF